MNMVMMGTPKVTNGAYGNNIGAHAIIGADGTFKKQESLFPELHPYLPGEDPQVYSISETPYTDPSKQKIVNTLFNGVHYVNEFDLLRAIIKKATCEKFAEALKQPQNGTIDDKVV